MITTSSWITTGRDAAWLADGIHMATVDEDIIVLDGRKDAYICLRGAAAVLSLQGGRVTAPAEVIDQLMAGGLVASDDTARLRLPLPPLPTRALSLPEIPTRSVTYTVGFWLSWLQARGLGRRTLVQILAERGQGARTRMLSEAALGQVTATFVRWLPWAPGQGACLYRAYLLRGLLRRAGGDAQWVFGVRTWPFSAHCWLQIGDTVLDDDPDRVGAYTPIMAV